MSSVMTQKRKTVILASSVACFQLPAILAIDHFHGSRALPAVVIVWSLVMAALLAYVMMNLVKLMQMRRQTARYGRAAR